MYPEYEEHIDYNRYAHLGLTSYEIWSVVIGTLLLMTTIIVLKKFSHLIWLIVTLGILAAIGLIPLLMIMVSIAMKIVQYGLILAFVIFLLYSAHKVAMRYFKERCL